MSIARRYGGTRAAAAIGLMFALGPAFAQESPINLAIDPSKPYVEIVLDHAGKRRPLSEFEAPTGLWLRLKNNSRIPIRVTTFEPGTTDPGIGIADEVLASEPSRAMNQQQSSRLRIAAGKGYSFDVGSPAVIGPGRSLLFSVPLDHVGPDRYFRIRFEFGLPPVSAGRQPYSFVDFTWSDVPREVRKFWTEQPPQ
jgi:hypothetical protein